MSNQPTTDATPDLDPAKLVEQQILQRQRQRASRLLLKKRRQKAGQ